MIFANRKYRSGSGFALFRWTDIEIDNKLYLRRLHIVQIPRIGALMLHWIFRPDPQPHLHDHPVTFLSLVLRGAYIERRHFLDGTHERYINRFNFMRAADAHRITHITGRRGSDNSVLTLVLAGPKRREWGFHTPSGWVHWRNYKEHI